MAERFWDWSVRIYERPGVAPLLLSLQDRHALSINLLLWSLWCAERFEEPQAIVIRKAVDLTKSWSADIVAPLRAVRRALKAPPPQAAADGAATLRKRLTEDERAAEQIEQGMLEALAVANLTPSADQSGTVGRARRTLAAYVRLTDAARSPGFSIALLETLIELTIQSPESGALNG